MKHLIFTLLGLFAMQITVAQAPEKINYQAVPRDSDGNVMQNETINVKFTILDANSSSVYVEEHRGINTNQYGLFNLQIGSGSVQSGSFSNIQWKDGGYSLKVAIDQGSGYQVLGTSTFKSVPYSMYAENVGNVDMTMDDLNNVTASNPKDDQVLKWDATNSEWIPADDESGGGQPSGSAGGDLKGNYPNPRVRGIQGNPISSNNPNNGQILSWDGSQWSFTSDKDEQTLTLNNQKLTISNGNTVSLPSSSSNLWGKNGSNIFYNSGGVAIGADSVQSSTSNPATGNVLQVNGKVGINTDTNFKDLKPATDFRGLYLYSPNLGPRQTGYTPGIGFKRGAGGVPRVGITGYSKNNNGDEVDLVFFTYPNSINGYGFKEQMRITDEGDVGIGTKSPSSKLDVNGRLTKSSGSFKIDHPLYPKQKYLNHSFVESPDMKNIYDGVARLNGKGEAQVKLPQYFDTLNKDYRYQLTPIGAPMPDLYIKEGAEGNEMVIAGGKPNQKVSWQVTGIRKDPYAQENRIQVVEEKKGEERGKYRHPEAYDQPREEGIGFETEEDENEKKEQ